MRDVLTRASSTALRRLSPTLLIVILGALAACSAPTPPAPPPVAAVEAIKPDQPFGLQSAIGEEYEGRASVLLRFDRALASTQPFDTRIAVKDANGAVQSGAWILEDDGSKLRFPYLQADQTYSLSLSAELEAADGSTLGKTTEASAYSGNLPPLLGFASQGSVLPARGSDGLPIVAVNASEADVEFFRVKPSSYSDFFARWQRNGQRSYWELGDISRLAEPVYANRFALSEQPNERVVSLLPIHGIDELRPPGLYLAIMKRPGQFDGALETTQYVVTDLGLHARSVGNTLHVHVASLESGQARSGVQIEVIDGVGKVIAGGSTDGSGDLALANYRPLPEHVLVGRAGEELVLLPFRQPALDLSEFAVAGRAHSAMDAYIWSGRDLYRPGETLHISALLRDFDGKPIAKAPPLFARLKQPDGRLSAAQTLEPGELGYYSLSQLISDDAATGRWGVELKLDPDKGEPIGSFSFRVEEFLPERLKLSLDSKPPRLAPGETLPLTAEGAFLYGAPAGGNRLKLELMYQPANHAVASLPTYFFGDPTIELPEGPQPAADLKLGDDGRIEQALDVLPETTLTAPVDVRVAASLFESGGRAIRRSLVRTIWPAEALVGVRPLFDPTTGADNNAAVGFEVLRSDAGGALSAATALEVELIREHRDYRWSWVDGTGWNSDYTHRYETVETQTLALDGTRPGKLEVRVEWGEYRLQIRDPVTGLTMRYPFTAGWSWNDGNRGVDAAPDKVKIALDKTGYQVGDSVQVTITPPHSGPGVLFVESSDGLLHQQAFEAKPGAQLTFTVEAGWQRHDIYVTALVMRPASAAANGSPQRAVGVAHLPMARGDRTLNLVMQTPEIVRPGETMRVELQSPDLAGQDGYAVVEAVDQGVLSLTGYALPDALEHFLARRALGVEARDVYGRVIERLRGERARLRYGGDAALAALPQSRRPTARVQTVALHKTPVKFDAEGKASVEFTMPDFNGALRVAALAYSGDRYGRAEAEAKVRAPLVLEVSTPRALAVGDSAKLTIDLQNLSGSARSYRVTARADALLSIDAGVQQVDLADGARRSISFPLRALPGQGVGKFSVEASSEDSRITRAFEIAVRPAWPAERRARARVQQGAGAMTLSADFIDGLMPSSTTLRLSLSSVPPLPFASAVQGLIGYPHGCIEQTSSRLWPLLWLDNKTAAQFGLTALDPKDRQQRIDAGFSRIAAMQMANGQFGFWPGDSWAQPQMTAFVAELLLSGRENGHAIPESVLELALKRLGEELLTGGDGYYSFENSGHLRFAASAHAGYVLAKLGRAPLGSLRALYEHERAKSLTALPLLQLGVALRLQGDTERGDAAIKEALEKKDARPPYLGDYGSQLRDEALMLALLHENTLATAEHSARLIALAREMRAPESAGYGLSTQEMLAVFRLGRQLLVNQGATLAGTLSIGERRIDLPAVAMYSLDLSADELRNGVRLDLTGEGETWVAEDALGAAIKPPPVNEQGMSIQRVWYRMDGSVFEGGQIKEGDTLIARLTVNSGEAVPDALVTDLLPAGLEVENLALGDTETLAALVIDGTPLSERSYGSEILHEEYRDDRYVAAVKLYGQATHLYYLVRAVSPGRFVIPPPLVEDMYRPRLSARGITPEQLLEVVPP